MGEVMSFMDETDNLSYAQIKAINELDRNYIQHILESYGFAVYDTETFRMLKNALIENIKDGTIPEEVIWKR